jgi:hypothetical protein
VVELDAVLPCTVFLPEIGVDEAVWDGGRFISFRFFLIIVLVTFSMVVFVQKLGLVLAGFVPAPYTGFRGWAFSPLISLR